MKKTSEELSRLQRDAVIRRHLIESGEIRVIRPVEKSAKNEQEHAKRVAGAALASN